MQITFIHTADKLYARSQMFGLHFPPVWIYTLTAHLRAIPGITFRVIDDRIQNISAAENSDIFLYSGINQDFQAILKNHAYLKAHFPDAVHAIGGPICWSFQKAGKISSLDMFDHCFIGDGELAIAEFVKKVQAGILQPKIIETKERFPLEKSVPMDFELIDQTHANYYGTVIEVSRGCPFLCEFCDIRVLPDNNRSHVKPVEIIVKEIDHFAQLGVGQMVLACDNLIGNSKWAEELCDAIIAWKKLTKLDPKFYTWLSIDIAKHPTLLKKLKQSGIDMLFIGVESFHHNSLLETAKVQNVSVDMVKEIRHIQAHGLIVVAGLIFGFDTDPDNIADITLDGILRSGLISGDPSLLTALPGTPLYFRMSLSNRLRDGKIGLGGFKYKTNIRYLKNTSRVIEDFLYFVKKFNRGAFQYARLKSLYACLNDFTEPEQSASGFTNAGSAIRVIMRNKLDTWLLIKRFFLLFFSVDRMYYILKAALLTYRLNKQGKNRWRYFNFWLFNWSNTVIKYARLSPADFDIGSVDSDFNITEIIPEQYESTVFEPIPMHKISMQRKNTVKSLRKTIEEAKQRKRTVNE